MHTRMHAPTHARTRTHTPAHTRSHPPTPTHTHTRTHTCPPTPFCAPQHLAIVFRLLLNAVFVLLHCCGRSTSIDEHREEVWPRSAAWATC